jgi:microcystin degradation protein MlrC
MIYGCDGGRTTDPQSPMNRLLRQVQADENGAEVLVVSVQAGFSSIDSPDIGPSVAVTTHQRPEVGLAIAQRYCRQIWDMRHEVSFRFEPIDRAVALAQRTQHLPGPLLLADHADNPGAGGYGDATAVLQAMLDANLQRAIFYAIHDPESVAAALQAGTGAPLTLEVGGKTAPHMGGGPLRLTGRVRSISDGHYVAHGPMGGGTWRNDGPTVVFQVEGVAVVLTSSNQQANDLAQLTSLGLKPTEAATIALKSMQHYKAAFQPIAREMVEVDSGALCTRNYALRPYRLIRRPIHPLDDVPDHETLP